MEYQNKNNPNFMSIYEDYESFKKEKKDLIKSLIKEKSKILGKFAPVIAVVDYLYEKHLTSSLDESEETFFSFGYDYICDEFTYIETILNKTFNSNIKELEKCADTINLLLFISDFKKEILSIEDPNVKKGMKLFVDFEEKINNLLDKKENVSEEYYGIFDDISYKVFTQNNIEIQTVDQIFYEVALEYGIYTEDTISVFQNAINNKIISTR